MVLTSWNIVKAQKNSKNSPSFSSYEEQLKMLQVYNDGGVKLSGGAKNKRLDEIAKQSTGTLKQFTAQCRDVVDAENKLIQKGKEFNSENYVAFLGDKKYTKGIANARKIISVYNDIGNAYLKSEEAKALLSEKMAKTTDSQRKLDIDTQLSQNVLVRQQEFAQQIGQTNAALGNSLTGSNVTLGSYIKSLIKTKAATIATTVATTAFNAAMSFGVSLAIQGVITLIDNLIHKSDKIIEKGKQAIQTVQDLSKSFKDLNDQTNGLKDRYAKLSQGVNTFGENASLTTEEYKEYIDLSNEIAGLFPTLNRVYDSNGNAVLNLSGDIDTVVSSLEFLVEAERQAKNEDIVSGMRDSFNGVNQEVSQLTESMQKATAEKSAFVTALQSIQKDATTATNGKLFNFEAYNTQEEFDTQEILNQLGVKYDTKTLIKEDTTTVQFSFDKEAFLKASQNYENQLDVEMQSFQKQISDKYQELNPVINSWLDSDFGFNELTSDLQNSIKKAVSTMQWTDADEMQSDIRSNFITPLQSASPEVQQAFVELFAPSQDVQNLTVKEYQDYINSIVQQLSAILPDEGVLELKIALGLTDDNGVNKIQTQIDNIKQRYGMGELNLTPANNDSDYQELMNMSADRLNKFYEFTASEGASLGQALVEFEKQFAQTASSGSYGSLDLSAYEEKINAVSDRISTLKVALASLEDGSMDASGLVELFTQFPDLAAYGDNVEQLSAAIQILMGNAPDDLITSLEKIRPDLDDIDKAKLDNVITQIKESSKKTKELDQNLTKLSDTLKQFDTVSGIMKSAESDITDFGHITLSTLQSILDQYPEMENSVAEYIAGVRSAGDVVDELKQHYTVDAKNYSKYLNEKLQNNTTVYNNFISSNSKLVSHLSSLYQTDLRNCKTYAEAKSAILKALETYAYRSSAATQDSIIDITRYYNVDTGKLLPDYEKMAANVSDLHTAQLVEKIQQLKAEYDRLNIAYADTNFDSIITNFDTAATTASESAAEDTTDAWKDAAEAEIATLEHLHNMKLISDMDYYNELNRINDKYYANNQDKYLSEYRSMLEKARSAYIEMVNAEIAETKYAYDSKLMSATQYYTTLSQINDKYYKDQSMYLEEYRSLVQEVYNGLRTAHVDEFEKEKSTLDHLRTMNVIDEEAYYFELEKLVTKYYKGNAEYLDEYQSEEEAIYQALFDMKKQALQEEVDALKEVADATQEAIDLEEKRVALFNAKNQKTVYTYDSAKGGWTWQANQENVKKAEDDLKNAYIQKEIEAMQKLVDALDDMTYNLNYVDPATGQTVQARYLKLLDDDQYEQLYTNTFGGSGIKSIVDNLTDMSSTVKSTAAELAQIQQMSPIYYNYNIDKVIANDVNDFNQSMKEFVNQASSWSALNNR